MPDSWDIKTKTEIGTRIGATLVHVHSFLLYLVLWLYVFKKIKMFCNHFVDLINDQRSLYMLACPLQVGPWFDFNMACINDAVTIL